jgi:hypothetical protein
MSSRSPIPVPPFPVPGFKDSRFQSISRFSTEKTIFLPVFNLQTLKTSLLLVFYSYSTRILLVCTRMYLCFTRMLLVCTRVLLVCTRTCMLLVSTRMLLVCTRVLLVCTRMYLCVTRMYSCGVLVTILFRAVYMDSEDFKSGMTEFFFRPGKQCLSTRTKTLRNHLPLYLIVHGPTKD